MRERTRLAVLVLFWVVCSAALAGALPLEIKGKVHDQYGAIGVERVEGLAALLDERFVQHHVADPLRAAALLQGRKFPGPDRRWQT